MLENVLGVVERLKLLADFAVDGHGCHVELAHRDISDVEFCLFILAREGVIGAFVLAFLDFQLDGLSVPELSVTLTEQPMLAGAPHVQVAFVVDCRAVGSVTGYLTLPHIVYLN